MTGRRDDEGSVLLLVIGLAAVLLVMVAVVVDVSYVVLAKRALADAADAAALSAAQQPDRGAISGSADALATRLPLAPADVDRAVSAYERDARTDQRGIDLRARLEEGRTVAVVDGFRTVQLPFVGWLGVAQVRLHAVGKARSPTTG